jgi:hypothetical protein
MTEVGITRKTIEIIGITLIVIGTDLYGCIRPIDVNHSDEG